MSLRRKTTETPAAAPVPSRDEEFVSSTQHRLWFLAELAPGSVANTLYRAYRVHGVLDVTALRAAWTALLHRHESLRVTIGARAGRPVQRITPTPHDESWSFADLTGAPPPDPARFLSDLATTSAGLADGPLARLHLARLAPGDHLVLLVTHRVVCDDESMAIVVNELSAAYDAVVNGMSPEEVLPVPGRRYTDYARSQHSLQLRQRQPSTVPSPPPPPLELPTDRARPPGPSLTAGVVRFDWDEEIASALARLSAAQHTAPATILLAAFQTLLYRYTGEERIAVGTPVSERRREFAGTVGTFENLLVLTTGLSGKPPFTEVVRRVSAVRDETLRHRNPPFDLLVRNLRPDRDPRRVPLCDVLFAVEEGPGAELRLTGTSTQPLPPDTRYARADLALIVDGTTPRVAGRLEYRSSLFSPSSARLFLGQLRTLLAAALAEPSLPVDDLPLDSQEHVRTTLRESDRRAEGPPGPAPVNELVRRVATRMPQATALSWGGERLSYRALLAHAARLTAALPNGVAGQPVAVRMPTGPHQVAALLAVLDAGAHLVCLGAGDIGERGRTMLAELRPACLVLDGPANDDPLARWYTDELGGHVLDVGALPGDGTGTAPPARAEPTDRAYVAHTSGSTGRPKGIPHSHGTLAQFVTWFSSEFGIGEGARMAQWAAPGYDASLCEVFAALVSGATVCPVPDRIRANPEKIADWLVTERITHFQTVPSFARKVLAALGTRSVDLPIALDHLLLAGEPLPGDLADAARAALPSVRLINLYGPTELILATWHEVADAGPATAPIGRPIPGRQVLVLDDHDRPCPAGVTGNLVIRSPHITPGYLGAGEAGSEPFRPLSGTGGHGLSGPCYRTGDLGRRRFDGALEFRGRRDFQVKFNGVRLELSDIEAALAAHDSIAECVVLATVGTDRLVTRLTAYVVPRPTPDGQPAGSATAWRRCLRTRFGDAMPPVSFRIMDELPRNAGGKIDRRRLPPSGPPPREAARTPLTTTEREIAALWSELGAEPTTVADSFFSAGGHSLLVPRLLHAVHERFGVACPLWDFFADPTVAGLAALVQRTMEAKPPPNPHSTEEDVAG